MILVTFIKKPNNGLSTPASTSTSHTSCDYSRAPSRPSHCTAPAASLKCYLLKTYTHDKHRFRDNWSPPSPNLKGLNGHYTRGNGGAGGAGGPAWHCVLLLCAVVCALFDTAAVCAVCLVMMKGNLFIWFQNPDHMKSLHHYFSNPAYANPYRRAVNVYRVSKHTHCPFHWLFLHKQTHKKKSLKHHISLWLNYRLSVSQTWNWIPTPACKAPPSDIKPICRIRHRTTTR